MSNSKWNELRLAMHGLGHFTPRWRTRDIETGYESDWDRDWFYHFQGPRDSFRNIEWLEIAVDTEDQRTAILDALANVHVPGEVTGVGIRIFGYIPEGIAVSYLEGSGAVRRLTR